MKCSLLYLDTWIWRKINWCIILRGVYKEEYSWGLIRLIQICYTSIILLCLLKEIFQKSMLWMLCFFSYSCQGELIQYVWINSSWQEYKSTLTLSINVKIKVTRVLCVLNSNGVDEEKEFNYKLCIEQKVVFLPYISKIHVILCCNVLKVFNCKLCSSF